MKTAYLLTLLALCLLELVVLRRWLGRWECRPDLCRDYWGYGGYDDGETFGYKDWSCQLPHGHSGDHWAAA